MRSTRPTQTTSPRFRRSPTPSRCSTCGHLGRPWWNVSLAKEEGGSTVSAGGGVRGAVVSASEVSFIYLFIFVLCLHGSDPSLSRSFPSLSTSLHLPSQATTASCRCSTRPRAHQRPSSPRPRRKRPSRPPPLRPSTAQQRSSTPQALWTVSHGPTRVGGSFAVVDLAEGGT